MKENAKLFLVSIITIIISITGSAVANTMLQANSISYKTSNGDTTDVNSALDRLFDAADINGRLGNTDISSIGDGTVTGAVNSFSYNLDYLENNVITLDKWEIIASNVSSGTYDISNYKYLMIMSSYSDAYIYNSAIMPISLLRTINKPLISQYLSNGYAKVDINNNNATITTYGATAYLVGIR